MRSATFSLCSVSKAKKSPRSLTIRSSSISLGKIEKAIVGRKPLSLNSQSNSLFRLAQTQEKRFVAGWQALSTEVGPSFYRTLRRVFSTRQTHCVLEPIGCTRMPTSNVKFNMTCLLGFAVSNTTS